MVDEYPQSQAITLPGGRVVCPKCQGHVQMTMREVGDENVHDPKNEFDCKNTFYVIENGRKFTVSQCCCYSQLHGYGGEKNV